MRQAMLAAAIVIAMPTAVSAITTTPPAFKYHGFQGEGPGYVPHFDERGADLLPTLDQLNAAAKLGEAVQVRFGPNGTPKVITGDGRFLSAAQAGTPENVARRWLKENAAIFGISAANVDAMETLRVSPLYESPDFKRIAQGLEPENSNVAHVVLLRQMFGGLPTAGREGLAAISISRDGRVAFVGASLSRDSEYTNTRQLSQIDALQRAAANVSLDLGVLEAIPNTLNDFLTYSSSLLSDVQRVRPRALPTADGLRHVWEVTLLDSDHSADRGHPQGFISLVDAQTGRIWVRDNALQHYVGDPTWRVFANTPNDVRNPNTAPDEDTRQSWCWNIAEGEDDPLDDGEGRAPEDCQGPELREMLNRAPWDETHLGIPTFTTQGNNASTAVSQVNFIAPDTAIYRPVAPDRNYDFTWTNAWYNSSCNPTAHLDPTLNFNDFEAATANLFAMHNRMHDWSYLLGWTEVNSNLQLHNFGNTDIARGNDPELGSSQAGRLTINGRDNANQLTLQDGIPGITNQYLWQSLPGTIYTPCLDGAYDMAIIAHEYTHATSNRMTAGPDGSLGGGQAANMGEAWSDLAAIEYLQSFGLTGISNESPYAMSVYVTGDPEAGIRNYAIDVSPLNYSNMQYDGNGLTSPHADSEIWGAANYAVRQQLIDKYQADFPFEDKKLQRECAEGFRGSEGCPGNRRWVQMLYDGLLIQPPAPSMLDARDAILASNLLRYDGRDLFVMWDGFASRGMGAKAFTAGVGDVDPRADFSSPLRDASQHAQITYVTEGTDGSSPEAMIYVGRFQARTTPVGDTNPRGGFSSKGVFIPGTYEFYVQAPGYGLTRFTETFNAGEERTLTFTLRPNLASTSKGAKASGDGDSEQDLLNLIDDTEETQWSSTDPALAEGKAEGAFVEGRQVTVKLASRAKVTDINVSAMLTGQNRFTALRSFDIATCDATLANCDSDAGFTTIYQSADDAFNGRYLRPKVSHLLLQNFDLPDTKATHLRLIVRDSQCTGGPDFQRETNPSGDPTNDPDCDTGFNLQLAALGADINTSPDLPPTGPEDLFNPSATPVSVRIAELQVFGEALSGGDSRNTPVVDSRSGLTRGGGLGLWVLPFALLLAFRRR